MRGIKKYKTFAQALDLFKRVSASLESISEATVVKSGPSDLAELKTNLPAQKAVKSDFKNYSVTARLTYHGDSFHVTPDFMGF
jgi:hypothetical protein